MGECCAEYRTQLVYIISTHAENSIFAGRILGDTKVLTITIIFILLKLTNLQ